MISVDEALNRVLERALPRPPLRLPLADTLGLVLAEDLFSDVDSPPHDKAMVDGYALIAGDLRQGEAELVVLEEVTAGAVPSQPVRSGTAIRIMTGAPIPEGADAVVMIERTQLLEGDGAQPRVRVGESQLAAGANILRRGTSLRRGQRVLEAGRTIRPIEIGVLGEVGCAQVLVQPRPSVAVLATGNELVPPQAIPAPGQIRNSNGPMLAAQAVRAGAHPLDLGIAADEHEDLSRLVRQGLDHDVLLLSGGVSAGVLDLVPGVLAALGVEQVFHKVQLKPGKPLWFGVSPHKGGDKLVFGLPGNPVSSLVCFELFVRPALGRLSGRAAGLARRSAILAAGHSHRSDRPTYYPARLSETGDAARVKPLPWKGSADLRTLADANCLILFPPGTHDFPAGDRVDVVLLD